MAKDGSREIIAERLDMVVHKLLTRDIPLATLTSRGSHRLLHSQGVVSSLAGDLGKFLWLESLGVTEKCAPMLMIAKNPLITVHCLAKK